MAKRHVRVKTLINMTFKHFKNQLEKKTSQIQRKEMESNQHYSQKTQKL